MSVYVIAEAGVNHNGDPQLARELIAVAREAGADAVKFQTFQTEELTTASAPKAAYQVVNTGRDDGQFQMLKKLELAYETFAELAECCKRTGIEFLSTAFDAASADMLEGLGMPSFKIASGEITNIPLVRHIARKRKPVLLSTGMSTLDDVERALGVIRREGAHATLLHCVTEYPAPPSEVNLRAMLTMQRIFGCPVGYSDHTAGTEVSLAAVALGACAIEKHFTLDRNLPGPDHLASLEPDELTRMVKEIRNVEACLGDGIKRPAPCELANREVARRSLFASSDIPEGASIAGTMLVCKRPGDGIPAYDYDRIIGCKASRAFTAGEQLDWAGICA